MLVQSDKFNWKTQLSQPIYLFSCRFPQAQGVVCAVEKSRAFELRALPSLVADTLVC